MISIAVLLLSGGLVAYAATTLFTQTIPGQTFTTPSLVTGANCNSNGNLVLDTSGQTINPTFSNNPSALVYGCDTSGATAFTVQGTSSTTVLVTPTFSVPSGWSLWAVINPSNCLTDNTANSNAIPLTSGSPSSFQGGSSWIYCLETSSASTFASFSIIWSQ